MARARTAGPLLSTLCALLLCAPLLIAPPPAHASVVRAADVTPARVQGSNRFETAAEIARLTFAKADTAVLVTGGDYPDALAGSFAAGVVNGPLLLVTSSEVPRPTSEALQKLGVREVVLLGGTGAIGAEVEDRLRSEGYAVRRIFGGTRYETAAQVAVTFGADWPGGTIDGQRPALLASGEAFPDALSAGPVSARAKLPLLLTPRSTTSPAVDEALRTLGVQRIVILGGEGAVSSAVERAYADAGYTVQRLAGSTRTGTAAAVADFALERLDGFSAGTVMLGRGDAFPDALAASIHGGVRGAPLLLTATPEVLTPETRGWLAAACPAMASILALGGGGAVSSATLSSAVEAAEACNQADVEVSKYTTHLPNNPPRTHNVHLAADTIDGRVIPPGGTFSLDDALGDRSLERGYRVVPNGCLESGEPVDCVGGGVSQVATTFLSAVWFSGLRIVRFRPHTTYFERYPECHEATLWRHRLDVVVVNDSPYPVTIDTFHSQTSVGVRLLSRPWAKVESWVSKPYAVDPGTGAFSVDCGRKITYPDSNVREDAYHWRYQHGYPGGVPLASTLPEPPTPR